MKTKYFPLLFAVVLLTSCGKSITTTTPEDQEWIVVGVLSHGWVWDIYGVSANDPQNTVLDMEYMGDQPDWSPDSQWIVYSTRHKGFEEDSEIYIVKSDGTSRIKLAQGDKPVWSPNGDQIAYVSHGEIYRLNVKCLINNVFCDTKTSLVTTGQNPDWSPDGHKMVFELNDSIYAINNDTPKIHKIFAPQNGGCTQPDWSPNSDKILFRCWGDIQGFYTINSDGTNLAKIEIGDAGGVYPKWSPSGEKFAFISYISINSVAGARSAVYVANADGSNLARLTRGDDDQIVWLSWMPSHTKPEICSILCQ